MKKMMRTALMATMAFALLLLPACGGGSDDGAQAPAVEESSGAGTAAGEEVSTDFAPAVDGVLTLKMANAGIIINGTGVAMPYTFAELEAAGIRNADDLRSIEMGAGDFYSVNMFLDENEDYLVLPYFYNDGEEAVPITEVDADFASDYGQIKAEWQCDGTKEMTYQITIPANTSATLRLPAGDGLYIYEGAKLAEEADGVQYIGTSEGYATYNVGSGSYVFMVSTEDPTSIKSVDESASLTGNQREKVFYSLDGKQLPNDSVHGIVITEGKKKIVK